MQKVRLKKQSKRVDKTLLILTLILTLLGLIAVADASAPIALYSFSDKFYFLKQQVIWGALGIFLLIIFSKIHFSIWKKFAVPLFFATAIMLIVVLIPSLSAKALGARRWIVLGPLSFQPSEFMKLSLAVYLAKIASKNKNLLAYIAPLVIISGLIMLQPDLGTTIVIASIGFSQIFLSGANLLHLSGVAIAAFAASLLVIVTSDYRRARLLTFLQQAQDPLGKGYHIRQVLLSLGAGGLFGVGLGQSRQKYLFLPEAVTDSIFAVIAEEVGFVGTTILIIIFAAFVLRGLKIAKHAPDKFSQILSGGLVAWIGGQAFLNMASMVALVPLTGIPLPFFSYGGSSLTATLIACGILLNISKHESKSK